MDAIKVTRVCTILFFTSRRLMPMIKVEDVLCRRGGQVISGTLHLTAHHLIFHHDNKAEDEFWVRL